MKTIKNIIALLCFLIAASQPQLHAQSNISLDEVLDLVLANSYSIKRANTQKLWAQAGYDFYQSELKPGINVAGSLPSYSKTSLPVIQSDGSLSFQPIRQANSYLSAYATQVIGATGGTVFARSDIQRFDDFSTNFSQFNGIPIRLGIYQPIFGFNPWKYRKKVENFSLEESKLQYNIAVEESLGQATDLFFDIIIAKQNLGIASTNQLVNENLLTITEERLKLGKVSKDEKLQLEIELSNAMLSVSNAQTELARSTAALYTFLGMDVPEEQQNFEVPENIEEEILDVPALLASYKRNRPEVLAYQKDKAQSEMDLAQVKAQYGVQADVQASIGLARGAETIGQVYQDPFDEQQFNVSLLVPILDWGKKKAAMTQVELLQTDVENAYQQACREIENNIEQRALFFTRTQKEIELLKLIMDKAEERFDISNNRYVLGDIDITNLTLAQREKDQAKRNYFQALKSYWISYYDLRALTGYDIINKQEIMYN